MIILRQKTFTRAEREAINQLYKVTKGYRRFPGGVSKNVEDAKSLKKLAIELNKGNQMSPTIIQDNPGIRKALDRVGLTKIDDKVLSGLNRKYNNKELLDRAQRTSKPITEQEFNQIKGDFDLLLSKVKDNRKRLDQVNNQLIVPSQSRSIMRFLRKKTDNAVFESAKPGTNPSAVLFDGSATSAKKAKNIFKRKSIPGMRMEKTNPQLREIKLKKKKGAILVSSDRPTSTVLHEYYHNVNGKTIPNYENYENSPIISPVYKSVMRGVGEAAEENLASSRVLRTMRNNITPLERESMNRALNSYVGNGRLDTLRERAIQRSKV